MATELAKAYVQILPSAKDFTAKLKEELGLPADKGGRHAGNRISSALKTAFAAAGVGAAIGKSLTEGMNLEQNLGGTAAVFGEFAASVQQDATEAYKNMGTSASEYMATANKMGSLFQGSGMQQQEALDLSTKAMQRAADVASVMGIDTTMAMESIAGAAKGNFTMMDNLGVAMNATTIQAYALEKGINFDWNTSTQAEKSRLAMQMFFDRTEQYAGNFARESEETFSGSLGAMKSAFQNFLGNVMTGQNVAPALENLKKTIITFAKNLLPAVTNILSQLPTMLLQMVITLAPTLMAAGMETITQIINGLSMAMPMLLTSIAEMIPKIVITLAEGLPSILLAGVGLLQAIVQGIIDSIPMLVEAMPTVIDTIITGLISSFDGVLNAAGELFQAVISAIPILLPKLTEALPQIIRTITDGLIKSIDTIIIASVELLCGLIDAIPIFIEQLIPQLPQIIGTITMALIEAIPQIMKAAEQALMGIVKAIPNVLSSLMHAMADVGLNLVKGLWNGIKDATGWVLDKIKGFGNSILDGIKDIFGIHSPSKKTAWMGEMLNTGLANGILDNMRPIQKAIDKVTGLTTGTFESELALKSTDMAAKQVPSDGAIGTVVTLLGILIDKLQSMKVVLDSGEVIGWVDAGLSREDQKNRRGVV